MRARQRVYLFVVFRLYAQFVTSYPAARRYAPLHPSPPIAADLRPCADRSAVRTALVACRAAALPIAYGASGLGAACLGQLGQTDGSRYRLMPPYGGGITVTTLWTLYKYIQLYFTVVYGSTT